ncbi:hypothetical protein [Glycomyces algeriensis]|uniref:Uncharacterized protein n=1 Tax=Glycomyces algeriensis TaxID=256037 RepID=A0A9W6G4B2_9ACTN|nr:hypothetical protein [Glycomyces algeriensis]MDA1367556.1 hypothetical protein [Glycomyces algeriensis]MDR7353081.1 hypothetical protein [Glycomyces algeriensis]GLI40774.1 hypothetical protein GALLR39Z86_06240 [Glycomyces algeriensis]
MEVFAQGVVEVVFGEASRAARRRRAAGFAASVGLGFQEEGRPGDVEASGWFDELEMLGVPFVQPVADTFAGSYQGRDVLGFENPVWSKRKRRHTPYRFTAVRLARAVPDLLVTAPKDAAVSGQWFWPDPNRMPLPVPQDSDRTVLAADPALADMVLDRLIAAGERPLDRSWTVRENWAVGWHRGRLRTRGANDAAAALRFLAAAAEACER